jgi:GH24 family phage-related lysozyme (muramidase)
MMTTNISQRGIKAIIGWETGGEHEYNRNPEWPGEASGITIGIGWDLGHTPATETARAWAPHIDQQTLAALIGVANRRGEDAKFILPHVRHLVISWDAALAVFNDVTIPTWYLRTLRIWPHVQALPGDCAAALVSIVFNRGPNLSGDRRREMLRIQELLRVNELAQIPDQIRAMKRLWPDSRGLRRRRDEEAELFQSGLVPVGD